MSTYGNFEAVREVCKSQTGSILAARTAGTSESADCCVKLIQLDEAMIAARDTSSAKNLLLSSALQQAMGNKSEFWAPVYELGSEGTNAFYVGRMFDRSAQTLIDHKVDLSSAELKIILLAVVEGLLDLESAFHRSHGNLKPSNVLLADKARILPGTVVLTDPDSSSEKGPSLTRTPDTKAVGELLYALVTHKPHVTARFPLPSSEKWKQLGSSGRQWFALCESLLNTVSRRGLPSLDSVHEKIAAIRPTHRRFPRAVLAALVLGSFGAGMYVERAQLAGWYNQASPTLVAFIRSRVPGSTSSHRAVLPASEPGPATLASSRVTGASDLLPNTDAGKQLLPPTTSTAPLDTSVRPVVVTPVVVAPVAPDDQGVNVVMQTSSPEFHSEAAKTEFTTRRDRFAAAHADATSAFTLGEWGQILAKIQGIDGDYPSLDGATIAGWPAGLAGVMNARRDASLVHAVDAAFDKKHVDPAPFQATLQRVQEAATAVVITRDALARGDLGVAKKSIAQCTASVYNFPSSDAALVPLFAPSMKEFGALAEINSSLDRPGLLEIADNESASLAVRLAAWYRAGLVNQESWPAQINDLIADDARADRLRTLLTEAGSVSAAEQVGMVETSRHGRFFNHLHDQPSVAAAVKDAFDPAAAAVLKKSPAWFQYDVALYVLKTSPAEGVTPEQKKQYADLASQVDGPGVQVVRDALQNTGPKSIPSLARSGPASIKGWQLRPGWSRDHCIYVANPGGTTLEFLRVHVPDEPDCYLCTTEAPVALMQALLNKNAAAIGAFESLNASTASATPGMRVWTINDKSQTVELDNQDYRRCFVISPTDQLPVQFVSPQAAFYLARRVGCRLPTSREWSAAFAQAKNSTDPNVKGFALTGWKLRNRQFAMLLTNPNRDPDFWPDENIFLGNLDPAKVPRGKDAEIWLPGDLARLGGRTASMDPNPLQLWPLSALEASSGFGFRSVGDGENFSAVFHDLVGNVSEYVMDQPVLLSERLAVPDRDVKSAADNVQNWFTPDHLSTVAVIGGSAMSPPGLDPTKPYPLPADVKQPVFSDVGFRLAFTDPASVPQAQQALLIQLAYVVAPVPASSTSIH